MVPGATVGGCSESVFSSVGVMESGARTRLGDSGVGARNNGEKIVRFAKLGAEYSHAQPLGFKV